MFRNFLSMSLMVCLIGAALAQTGNAAPATQPVEQMQSTAAAIGDRTSESVQKIQEEGLTAEQVIAWIVAGGLVGNLVGTLFTMRSGGFGVFGNLLVGGIGAFVGGFAVRVLGLDFGWPRVTFRLEGLLVACVFSIVLVAVYRKFKGGMHRMTAPENAAPGSKK